MGPSQACSPSQVMRPSLTVCSAIGNPELTRLSGVYTCTCTHAHTCVHAHPHSLKMLAPVPQACTVTLASLGTSQAEKEVIWLKGQFQCGGG